MTTPLPELLAKVPSLNDPAQPFTYAVVGDTIVGQWDIVSAKSLYPTEFATIDKDFTVTVTFNQDKGTWSSKDHAKNSNSSFGTGGFSVGTDSFSGKMSKKSFSFTLGGANETADGVSPVLAWSFDTARIKNPLFAFLEANGWEKKKGFFGR